MSNDSFEEGKKRIVEVLQALTDEERKLFAAVLQVERQYLHLGKPQVKQELLQAVREYIK